MATKKQLAIGCGVVGVVLFVGAILTILIVGGISVSRYNKEHDKNVEEQTSKRTANTTGTIVEYKSVRGPRDSYDQSVTFEYEVNGIKYTARNTVNNGDPVKFAKGVKGKVCYDPANPKDNASFGLDMNYKCGT